MLVEALLDVISAALSKHFDPPVHESTRIMAG